MTGHGLLTIPQLAATAAAVLGIAATASWLLVRNDREQRRLLVRIDALATPYARANPLATMGRRKSEPSGARLVKALFALFRYEPARAHILPVRPAAIIIGTLAGAVGASVALSGVLGLFTPVVAAALWVIAARRAFNTFEARRAHKLYLQFPEALAMIARSVRVGIPVGEAIRNVAHEGAEPTATEFAVLADQITIGVALDEALRGVATRNRLPEYRFFATALSLQAQTGGGLSETLDNLADVIRKRVAVRNRAHAMASEARTSTYILAALPVFTTGALALINPSYIALLFTTGTGNAVFAAAVFMLVFGMFVMRTIIARTLR